MSNWDNIEILLIEDDQVDVLNIKRVFKKCGIDNPVNICGNGVEAIDFLRDRVQSKSALPQIILLDINMPKMNGLEFLTLLRKEDELKAISVFVLTTSNDETDIITAHQYNVAGYFIKPVYFDEFVETIKKLSEFWRLNTFPKLIHD